MRKLTAFLMCTTLFSFGVILGFLLSPVKEGISIGNNSGNWYKDEEEI